jgi:hypothetical protein
MKLHSSLSNGGVNKKKVGRELAGMTYNEMPVKKLFLHKNLISETIDFTGLSAALKNILKII